MILLNQSKIRGKLTKIFKVGDRYVIFYKSGDGFVVTQKQKFPQQLLFPRVSASGRFFFSIPLYIPLLFISPKALFLPHLHHHTRITSITTIITTDVYHHRHQAWHRKARTHTWGREETFR